MFVIKHLKGVSHFSEITHGNIQVAHEVVILPRILGKLLSVLTIVGQLRVEALICFV